MQMIKLTMLFREQEKLVPFSVGSNLINMNNPLAIATPGLKML